MGAVETEDGTSFRVDLDALQLGFWARLLGRQPRTVDPYVVGLAIRAVMRLCPTRSANGERLVWNEYRLFLAASDYDRLRALEARLARDIGAVLLDELRRRRAQVVGEVSLRLAVDEDGQLPSGIAVVRPAFVELAHVPQAVLGEMTVRIGGATSAVYSSALPAEGTVRVGSEGSASTATITWSGGESRLAVGERATLGRPHSDAAGRFIPLLGATAKISKQHAWIEVGATETRVGRFSTANPVVVNGRPVQPGGEIGVEGAEVTIDLSSGELSVTVRRG